MKAEPNSTWADARFRYDIFHEIIAESPALEPLAMAVADRRANFPSNDEYEVAMTLLKEAWWDEGGLSISGYRSPDEARAEVSDTVARYRRYPNMRGVAWKYWQREKLLIADLLEKNPPDDLREAWELIRKPEFMELLKRAEAEGGSMENVVPLRAKDEPNSAKDGKNAGKGPSIIIPVSPAPKARPFIYRDPASIPQRPWVYGNHLLRKAYSVTVAPGAAGKSTTVHTEFIAMASGRNLLGVDVPKKMKVWYINLEEEYEELERRTIAAMMHHGIGPAELDGHFYMSGSESDLVTAIEHRNEVKIVEPIWEAMVAHVKEMGFDAICVDPFAQSHNVAETNEAYKMVAMEWRRLAQECNCAVELVHHTRKPQAGQQLSSQDGRGGGALVNHARDGRVINKASPSQRQDLGIPATDHATYFTLTSDKANYSTGSGPVWYRTVGVHIGNGDVVATVEQWDKPDAFDGISTDDVLRVQKAIDGMADPREAVQAATWVGYTVADVLGWDRPDKDTPERARVKELIATWKLNGVLVSCEGPRLTNGTCPPILRVGEWIHH